MTEKSITSLTITITPELDWSAVLTVIPTEQLKAEIERRERSEESSPVEREQGC